MQSRFINSSWFTESGLKRLQSFSEDPQSHLASEREKRPGWPEHYTHRMAAGLQWSYLEELTDLTDPQYLSNQVVPKRQLTKSLYEAAWQARIDDPLKYKSVMFDC